MSKSRAGSERERERRREGGREKEREKAERQNRLRRREKGVWRRIEIERERPRHGEVTARHFQSRSGTQKGNCFSPDVAFAQQAGYNVPTELMSPISEMIKN